MKNKKPYIITEDGVPIYNANSMVYGISVSVSTGKKIPYIDQAINFKLGLNGTDKCWSTRQAAKNHCDNINKK